MRRRLFIFALLLLVLVINKHVAGKTTASPSGKQQSDRTVADTQTQCLSGEQGVMCQAQALAALVDENGKLQSSHSQSQAAGAASDSTLSKGDDEPEDEPKEAQGAGDLDK